MPVFEWYVGNICYPKFVSLHGLKILYQVGIALEVVFTVSSVHIALELANKQLISFKHFKESIPSHDNLVLDEEGLQFNKKFSASTSWLQFSYCINLLQYDTFLQSLRKQFVLMFMISL